MLEKGIWRNNPETFKLVREVWPKVKGLQIYYYDIGNMRPDEIISLIKRFSYKHIPKNIREDPNALGFLVHFDYLKPFQFDPRLQEYQEMGFFIQKIKYLIKDIAPCNFWASLQAKRSGVTNNRLSTQVDDSDAIFSLSDRLIGASTHAWILRHKLTDELTNETTRFGNLKFKCMKHRHLGIDYQDAINLVQVKKGIYARNYINLQHNSFYFEDRGDLNEMVEELKEEHDLQDSTIVDEEANGM
jgi:hypothetical protein